MQTALKDCARIPVKYFAFIVVLETGEARTYTTPALSPYSVDIFSQHCLGDFRRGISCAQQECSYPDTGLSMVFRGACSEIANGLVNQKCSLLMTRTKEVMQLVLGDTVAHLIGEFLDV